MAPPDHHLVVADGHVRVTKGPRENRFRPAVDPLFRSAALAYGSATIAVVLTGNLDDGAAGVSAVKQLHGVAVVQDPHDALFPSMPMNAIQNGKVDHIVPIAAMGPLLVKLVAGVADLPAEAAMPAPVNVEVKIAMEVLQLKNGSRLRFRCHTGHAYSPASLLAALNEGVEDSLWSAIRALEEGYLLLDRLAEHLTERHNRVDASQISEQVEEAKRQCDVIRHVALERKPLGIPSS